MKHDFAERQHVRAEGQRGKRGREELQKDKLVHKTDLT